MDEYTEIKTKHPGLDIRIRKSGSCLTKNIYCVKGIYKLPKQELEPGMTLQFMMNLIYMPELRLSWDEGYKELVKLEGDNQVYIIKSWLKSPMFIISERDVIDKRVEFFKDNIYYNFCSSVNDNVR